MPRDAREGRPEPRWARIGGGRDRLYINVTKLGLEVEYYKTGNVRDAKFEGETMSNASGRRMLAAKVYVDVADGELHVSAPSYVERITENAQALIDAAYENLPEVNPVEAAEDYAAAISALADGVIAYTMTRREYAAFVGYIATRFERDYDAVDKDARKEIHLRIGA